MRNKEEEEPHDKAVDEVAKVEFPFPNRAHANWKTDINPNGEQNRGVRKNQESVYPDIVVWDTEKKKAEMIGEVETASTVNEEHADQWKEYSSLGTFFLYIPKNYASEALRILYAKKIRCSLRMYEFDAQGKIVIRIVTSIV